MNQEDSATATMTAPATATPTAPAPAPAAAPPTRAPREPEQEKLKAIRDLLIGDQLQDLGKRFHAVEQSQQAQYARIGSELMTKFEALKVLSKSQVDELNTSVAEMVGQLREKNAELNKEVEEGRKQLADLVKRVDDMPSTLTQQFRKMHEQFAAQMAEFSRAMRARQDEAARNAISRQDLADLLNGLARKIAPEESPKRNADSAGDPRRNVEARSPEAPDSN